MVYLECWNRFMTYGVIYFMFFTSARMMLLKIHRRLITQEMILY